MQRPVDAKGFVLVPKRWVVERSRAWHGRYRRQSRHDEWFITSAESMIEIGGIQNMLRRLEPNPASRIRSTTRKNSPRLPDSLFQSIYTSTTEIYARGRLPEKTGLTPLSVPGRMHLTPS